MGQWKVSKVKIVPFVAGIDRHSCWFVDFADFLAASPMRPFFDGEAAFLFPELLKVTSPGTAIGNYIKACIPYVKGLSTNANAGGIRPGACNSLLAQMPAEFAVQVTGHELKGTSAIYNYFDSNAALTIPGADVLAGWAPPPWGHTGLAPRPANLSAIQHCVDPLAIDAAIDKLFRLDSASPPTILQGGRLRQALEAAFATAIMYYPERIAAGEMEMVQAQLRSSVISIPGVTLMNVTPTLINWAALIKAQFNQDNLGLTTRQGHPEVDKLVAVVQAQAHQINVLTVQMAALMGIITKDIKNRDQREHAAAERAAAICSASAGGAGAAATGDPDGDDDDGDDDDGDGDTPAAGGVGDVGGIGDVGGGSVGGGHSGWGFMQQAPRFSYEPTLSKLSLVEFFLRYTKNGHMEYSVTPGRLKPQLAATARVAAEWMRAMATPAEMALLKSPKSEEGMRRRASNEVEQQVRAYLASLFKPANPDAKLPTNFQTTWLVSMVETTVRNLDKATGLKPKVTGVDHDVFAAFRVNNASTTATAASANSPSPKRSPNRPLGSGAGGAGGDGSPPKKQK